MKRVIKIAVPLMGIVILSSSLTAFADDFDVNEDVKPSQIHTQIRELIENGDIEGAIELRDEFRFQFRDGNRFKNENHVRHEGMGEMKEILESGDYDAWSELMQERPNFGENINQDTFQKMTEVHELMESGDIEAARELRQEFVQELGLENVVRPAKGGKGFHKKQMSENFGEMNK